MSIKIRLLQGCLGAAMAVALAACGQQGAGHTSAPASASAAAALPGSIKITSYGPASTKAGVAFNAQPDGGAAIWIRLDQSLNGEAAAVDFNGTLLTGNISGNLVTAAVPAALYAKPGTFDLHVIARNGTQSVQSNDVKFTVE